MIVVIHQKMNGSNCFGKSVIVTMSVGSKGAAKCRIDHQLHLFCKGNEINKALCVRDGAGLYLFSIFSYAGLIYVQPLDLLLQNKTYIAV